MTTVPEPMYQAMSDKLTLEIRENLQLRAEIIVLTRENARLAGELERAGMSVAAAEAA